MIADHVPALKAHAGKMKPDGWCMTALTRMAGRYHSQRAFFALRVPMGSLPLCGICSKPARPAPRIEPAPAKAGGNAGEQPRRRSRLFTVGSARPSVGPSTLPIGTRKAVNAPYRKSHRPCSPGGAKTVMHAPHRPASPDDATHHGERLCARPALDP
jgi:hypothetical protein